MLKNKAHTYKKTKRITAIDVERHREKITLPIIGTDA
jgi:hypothetical protein